MRGLVAGLTSPHPLADTLPAMMSEDRFANELCASFDAVLAPVLLTLDTFADYLDPATTPDDMIVWLAQWVGLSVDPGTEPGLQRHELAVAGSLNPTRGTRRSIELALQSALGVDVEVSESGGARWSPSPGGPLPGEEVPLLRVVVGAPVADVDTDRLDALVRSVAPAHVIVTIAVQPRVS
ncbi:MAG: phage tail protein [Microlunatus sp.]|nr:phage tail protein [Microlunatus sp.]